MIFRSNQVPYKTFQNKLGMKPKENPSLTELTPQAIFYHISLKHKQQYLMSICFPGNRVTNGLCSLLVNWRWIYKNCSKLLSPAFFFWTEVIRCERIRNGLGELTWACGQISWALFVSVSSFSRGGRRFLPPTSQIC